jgi:hypothetical protein
MLATYQRIPIPVKLQHLYCGSIPFLGYQLPTHEITMTKSQALPSHGKIVDTVARNFVVEQELPTIKAKLPNHSIVVAYPLNPTVTELWKYLDSYLTDKQKQLRDALLAGNPVLEESWIINPETQGELRVETEAQLSVKLAKNWEFQAGQFIISVLEQEENIYLSDSKGLSVIGVPANWIAQINPAQKKAQLLKQNGFSFKEETLFYQKTDLFQVRARIWSDWLAVWEYFASKGNRKALTLLKTLALQGLGNKVESLLKLD